MDNNFIKTEKVSKVLLAMVIPSVIAGVINQLNIVLDTYFLGNYAQYATEAQAATTSATSLLLLMNAFSFMLAIGGAIYATQKLGEDNLAEARRSTANSFVTGWMLYAAFLVVLLPLLPSLMELLSGDETRSSILYTNSYYYGLVLVLGFPTIIFMVMPVQFIRSEGRSKIIVITGIIQIIINIILDYLFIAEGTPISLHGTEYEALGAAIGTIASQAFQAIVLMIILFRKNKSQYQIELKNVKLSVDWFKQVITNGVPQFIVNILLAVGIFTIGFMLTKSLTGDELSAGTAAYGTVVRLVMMMFLLLNGAVQGIQGFFAYQYGSGLKDRIDEGLKLSIRAALIFGVISAVLVFIFSEQIAGVFTSDANVIGYVSMGLKVYAFTLLVFPFAHLCFGLFAALGYPKIALYSTLIRDGLIFITFSIMLPLLWGTEGAVICMPITHLIGSLVIISFYFRYRKTLGVKEA